MRREDQIRLQHMLDAIRDALDFAKGRTRDELDSNRQLVLALVKSLEIIGEAANQVSSETQTQTPQLPWRDMIDMRHRLVHGYYDINLDIVWRTLRDDLPPLQKKLQLVLKKQ